jgi:hypothetical protein
MFDMRKYRIHRISLEERVLVSKNKVKMAKCTLRELCLKAVRERGHLIDAEKLQNLRT